MLVVLVHKDSHCLAANGVASTLEKDPTNRKYILVSTIRLHG